MGKPYMLIEQWWSEYLFQLYGCGLIALHFDLLYPFKVLNIPRNDPILAKRKSYGGNEDIPIFNHFSALLQIVIIIAIVFRCSYIHL
jgi:hypothetical protein